MRKGTKSPPNSRGGHSVGCAWETNQNGSQICHLQHGSRDGGKSVQRRQQHGHLGGANAEHGMQLQVHAQLEGDEVCAGGGHEEEGEVGRLVKHLEQRRVGQQLVGGAAQGTKVLVNVQILF
jgi:hypothetical protein